MPLAPGVVPGPTGPGLDTHLICNDFRKQDEQESARGLPPQCVTPGQLHLLTEAQGWVSSGVTVDHSSQDPRPPALLLGQGEGSGAAERGMVFACQVWIPLRAGREQSGPTVRHLWAQGQWVGCFQ